MVHFKIDEEWKSEQLQLWKKEHINTNQILACLNTSGHFVLSTKLQGPNEQNHGDAANRHTNEDLLQQFLKSTTLQNEVVSQILVEEMKNNENPLFWIYSQLSFSSFSNYRGSSFSTFQRMLHQITCPGYQQLRWHCEVDSPFSPTNPNGRDFIINRFIRPENSNTFEFKKKSFKINLI